MKVERTQRGFERVDHPVYPPNPAQPNARLVQQSSAVDHRQESMVAPGTSFLWVGVHHHLNRDEVSELAAMLNAWLRTGSLEL